MIIVSITGPRMSDALTQVASSDRYADAFEFRLDLIRSPELALLMLSTAKPTIVTCRPEWEGGAFRGGDAERMELLGAASMLGADYVDLELNAGRRHVAAFLARRKETRVILSLHVPRGKRFDAGAIYERMRTAGPDVMKFAFHADDAWENRTAFDFLARAKRDRRRAVAIAMGEAGEPSRILYRVFGGWGTYASSEDGRLAAPGQIQASLLKELYRADRLNPATKIFGVVGFPVSHSKGIFVHNPLFARAGINAVYCRFAVTNLSRFMRSMVPFMHGFSVTLPHKKEVMRFLTRIDPTARAIGAVNTVLRRKGGLWGTNTDAPGALDAIERVTPVKGKTVLILGAGGAARAIAFEARQRGAHVIVTNRTAGRARALASEFAIGCVPFNMIGGTPHDIFVNATSVGMSPDVHRSPVPARSLKGKLVFDAVYNPPMTLLLRNALNAGARIIRGTEMYINQGAQQFLLYTGVAADVRLMRRVLLDSR